MMSLEERRESRAAKRPAFDDDVPYVHGACGTVVATVPLLSGDSNTVWDTAKALMRNHKTTCSAERSRPSADS